MVTDRVRLVLHLAFTFHRVNMVNSRHILAFFCFVGLQWLPVGQNEANAETIERIAAIAGDDIITLNDVRNDGVMRYLVKGKDLHDIDDSPKRSEELEEIVKELVQAKLIARQAKKNNIYVGDREVDAQLKEMFSRAGQSEESFKAMMAQEGIDWQAYRAYLRSEIEAQFVIRSELAGQVAPAEADVIACAQELAPDAKDGVTVTLRQIIIPEIDADSQAGLAAPMARAFNGVWWNSLDSSMKRYAQGVQEIAARNPDKFVDFVKQFSTGRSAEREGVLGSFSPGDLSKDFSSVFALQKGDVSALIETSAGYHIIRVDDVVHGESSAWKATMDQCREQIAMKESQRLVVSWLNDLMEKNFVSILVNEDLSK